MSPFDLQRLGQVMEPEPGNAVEFEGVLNPAAGRGPYGRGGCEDPRITFVDRLRSYLMTYTGHSPAGPRIALAVSEDLILRNGRQPDRCRAPGASPRSSTRRACRWRRDEGWGAGMRAGQCTAARPRTCGLWRTLRSARTRWSEVDADQRAAAFAYYLLLSLLPLAFILVSAGSLFVERAVATREIVQWVHHYVPLTDEQTREAEMSIRGVLEARGRMTLTAFPLLTWGALKFLRTLIRTSNRIWASPIYNWWRLPLRSLGLLGIIASAVLFGVLVPGVGRGMQPTHKPPTAR